MAGGVVAFAAFDDDQSLSLHVFAVFRLCVVRGRPGTTDFRGVAYAHQFEAREDGPVVVDFRGFVDAELHALAFLDVKLHAVVGVASVAEILRSLLHVVGHVALGGAHAEKPHRAGFGEDAQERGLLPVAGAGRGEETGVEGLRAGGVG